MGGHIFKGPDGSALTTTINKYEVPDTLASLQSFLAQVGLPIVDPIGSTGKRDVSGDIDVAVGPVKPMDKKEKLAFKSKLKSDLGRLLGSENIALSGDNMHIRFPIEGRFVSDDSEQEYVQVDLMFSEEPTNTAWLMAGTASGLKGVFRNLLLAFVAKVRSIQSGDTITIKFPGGVQVVAPDGSVKVERNESPQVILDILDLPVTPADSLTFDGVLAAADKDQEIKAALRRGIPENNVPDFMAYVSRLTKDDPASQGILLKAMGDEALVREAVRSLLRVL